MDELNDKREETGKKQMRQARLQQEHLTRLMDDYYNVASERSLDEVQFGFNISMLMEILGQWQDKIDDKTKPDQYNKLSKMRTACVEMLTHQMSLRQKLSFSIVETKKWQEQWRTQHDKAVKLEDELRAFKAQTEFNNEK